MVVYKTCLLCEKIFGVSPYRKDTAKFCSMKCYGEWEATNPELLARLRKFGFQKGDKVRLGTHHTEEAKRKVGVASRGRKPTEKQLEALKMGWYLKGKSHVAWNKGKKLSEVGRKKLSVAHKGIHQPNSIKALNDYRIQHGGYFGENNPRWTGGTSYPTITEWRKITKEIRKRDNYTCQLCRLKEKGRVFDVHHIIPYKMSHNNSASNLITLCPSCHMKEEWKLIKDGVTSAQQIRDVNGRLLTKNETVV